MKRELFVLWRTDEMRPVNHVPGSLRVLSPREADGLNHNLGVGSKGAWVAWLPVRKIVKRDDELRVSVAADEMAVVDNSDSTVAAMNGKVVRPFDLGGVACVAFGYYADGSRRAFPIVPREEYDLPTFAFHDIAQHRDDAARKHWWDGLLVKWKDEQYVIAGPSIRVALKRHEREADANDAPAAETFDRESMEASERRHAPPPPTYDELVAQISRLDTPEKIEEWKNANRERVERMRVADRGAVWLHFNLQAEKVKGESRKAEAAPKAPAKRKPAREAAPAPGKATRPPRTPKTSPRASKAPRRASVEAPKAGKKAPGKATRAPKAKETPKRAPSRRASTN